MKQTVTLIALFVLLVTSMVSMGLWFNSYVELGSKQPAIDALNDKKIYLDQLVNGGKGGSTGLKGMLEDHPNGLKDQYEAALKRTQDMEGDAQSGLKRAEASYDEKDAEIQKKWHDEAQAHWKNTYDDWLKLNGDIAAASDRLQKLQSETDEKSGAAQSELDQALNDETTERAKIVTERKKMNDEIGQVRFNQEEVNEKINAVTREVRKLRVVAPQGHIIASAPEVKTCAIDLGSAQGVHKGLQFEVYSGAHAGQVHKCTIEVTDVSPSSAQCVVLPPKAQEKVDPVTGWVASDPNMKFSVYAAGGPEDTDTIELQKPKSREDRVEALRIEKIEREQGLEAAEKAKQDVDAPASPSTSSELGKGFFPIAVGDWISNPDFSPIVPNADFQRQTRDELLSMRDVNVGSLTFYFTDAVRPYRRDYLKRLCERNGCKGVDALTADVNYVVSSQDMVSPKVLEDKLAASKDKDDASVSAEVRTQRKILADLVNGRKIGAQIVADDEVEALFDRRQRKLELLRGKVIQPGQHTFYVSGETKNRSAEQLAKYITEHGGVMVPDLDTKVDYVVVGGALDQAFLDKVKHLGLKIIREDELPEFFGVK